MTRDRWESRLVHYGLGLAAVIYLVVGILGSAWLFLVAAGFLIQFIVYGRPGRGLHGLHVAVMAVGLLMVCLGLVGSW